MINETMPRGTVLASSAVLGDNGYPTDLISILFGEIPSPENPGMLDLTGGTIQNMNTKEPIKVGDVFQVEIAGVEFNSTIVGSAATIPFVDIIFLWHASTLTNLLGPALYEETFGHQRPNYLIVKAESMDYVEEVVNGIRDILKDRSVYQVRYDGYALSLIKQLKTQTEPLYRLIGVASLGATFAVIFFASYVNFNKRSWEIGLLLSQGWCWRSILYLYSSYFLVIAVLSGGISLLLSVLISNLLSFNYEVYRTNIIVSTQLSELQMMSAIPAAIGIGFLSVYLLIWRSKKLGVEGLLREY
jgi:ABC-type antimicrobial peptide transport system permease subunit